MVNNIINNCKEVILEMFSYIYLLKYGFGYASAKRLLESKTFRPLVSKPDFDNYIKAMPRTPENILFSTYEFLKFALQQLYVEIQGDYIAASRRKSYLASTSFVQKFKKKITELEKSSSFADFIKPWKLTGKLFIGSLPQI